MCVEEITCAQVILGYQYVMCKPESKYYTGVRYCRS